MTETLLAALPPTAASPDAAQLLVALGESLAGLAVYFDTGTQHCCYANQAFTKRFGLTPQSVLGKTPQEIVGLEYWTAIAPHVEQCLRGEHVNYLQERPEPDGTVRMHRVSLVPHCNAQGKQTGVVALTTDYTNRWLAERTVRESEERTRKFSEATEEAIAFHHQGVILDCNDAMKRLTGFPIEEVMGRSIFDFIEPETRAIAIEAARGGGEQLYEVCIAHREGQHIPVEVLGKTMPHHTGDYRVVVVRDIRARKAMQEREVFLARHDALTGLLNRRALLEQLDLTLAQARAAKTTRQQQVALLYINLDHLKTINDSLGYSAGDQILCAMADRLRSTVAERGFITRLGGDEFVVVLPSAGSTAAAELAGDLYRSLNAPFKVADTGVCLSLSIGISLFPQDENTSPGLLREAESALRQAKNNGRGHYQFSTPGVAGHAMASLQLQRELHTAIEHHQFVLHYQPVMHVADGMLAGFEALVRWQHPERGLLAPGEFIAFAETHGMISHIGRWVMREACRQLKAWHDAGLPQVPVAVNLSAFEFRQRDVAKDIAAVLAETGLAPQFLEVELTETVLMQQSDQVLETLQAIKALGVGIAIDDFGTGYSSLSYLKRYPIDKLKIDRSFVMDTPGDSDDVAIVTAIVQLGRSLKLRTVAEGVETPEQRALLLQLGCDLAQGYGIARPMAAEKVVDCVRDHCIRDLR